MIYKLDYALKILVRDILENYDWMLPSRNALKLKSIILLISLMCFPSQNYSLIIRYYYSNRVVGRKVRSNVQNLEIYNSYLLNVDVFNEIHKSYNVSKISPQIWRDIMILYIPTHMFIHVNMTIVVYRR